MSKSTELDLAAIQKGAIQQNLIKMFAAVGIFLGVVGMVLHHFQPQGGPQFVIGWGVLALFNVLALATLKKRTELAGKLMMCAVLVPALSLHIYQYGAGSGVYFAIPTLVACAWALLSKRFAFWFSITITAVFLAVLAASQVYGYGHFQFYYRQLEPNFYLNMSMLMLLSVAMVSSAVHAIKRTYVATQDALIDEKNQAQGLRREIAQSYEDKLSALKERSAVLKEKSSVLNMLLHMQELGKIYGMVYIPADDALYHLREDSSEYLVATLQETNLRYRQEIGVDSRVIELIQQALKDKENWDVEFSGEDRNGEACCYRVRGEVELSGERISKIIVVVNDVTENKTLTEKLSRKANTDDLTGILTRRRFEELFESCFVEAVGGEKKSMYLFIDLDRFKIVNDTSGHPAGDALLKEVCAILKSAVRKDDIVGRLGGDEFGIILRECEYDVALNVAETIRKNIEEYRLQWEDTQHRVEACIGVVAIDPDLGSQSEVQALADSACYRAKHKGRNRVESVLDDQSGYMIENTEKIIINKLDQALEQDLLSLWYQEIVPVPGKNLPLRREVLIRMYDTLNASWMSPIEFLPVAERYNRSVVVDSWVINQIISKLERVEGASYVEYWVNLSAQSVSDSRFASFLKSKLENTSLPPGTINFEVTETSAIINIDSAINMMSQIKAMGSKFALDDFGVGHASFGNLRRLPIDCVKIDGMFIRNIVSDNVDKIFTKSIIDIAHAFGMSVTAEYVENQAISDMLCEMGVDYLQGYFYAKPEPLVDKLTDHTIDRKMLRSA